MTEEMRLISLGYPENVAICLCRVMRRSGTLCDFIAKKETERRDSRDRDPECDENVCTV